MYLLIQRTTTTTTPFLCLLLTQLISQKNFTLQDRSLLSSGRNSPTLDDLEEKKKLLLDALNNSTTPDSISIISQEGTDMEISDKEIVVNDAVQTTDIEEGELESEIVEIAVEIEDKKTEVNHIDVKLPSETANTSIPNNEATSKPASPKVAEKTKELQTSNQSDSPKTPDLKGHVKTSEYGTPVMNIASPFTKLPSDEKFSKDICDVINFENLPNSTGKYKQISKLLKKVKSEVDRIQES